MPRYYPAFIDVRGRDCVVVGGGDLGEEKVVKLLECDASVVVVSAEVTDKVRNLPRTARWSGFGGTTSTVIWRGRS